ncbi:MAG: DUF4935 domain-containing protein [Clostridia bacterium]|nr:DUF4935 domain-containing protein [Clostridia bacterium]
MDFYITTTIVDTSAIIDEQCDFLGLTSSTLPSFFELLLNKGILLLDHDVLHREIEKHIPDSAIVARLTKLTNLLERNFETLLSLGVQNTSFIDEIKNSNICHKVKEKFEEYYTTAQQLPYPDAKQVFDAYFSTKPPFAESGNKKKEFPDAFVIEAVKNYLKNDETRTLLIISKDTDWKNALSNEENVLFAESIDDAMKILQKEQGIIEKIINICEEELINQIESIAECECYEISDHELIDDDLEINSIVVNYLNTDIVPLKITNNKVIFKCSANLSISGKATVFDEEQSVWSSEDRAYIYQVNSEVDFTDADAEALCEIEINFDLNDLENSIDIDKVKIINKYSIDINLNYKNTIWNTLYENDDFCDND